MCAPACPACKGNGRLVRPAPPAASPCKSGSPAGRAPLAGSLRPAQPPWRPPGRAAQQHGKFVQMCSITSVSLERHLIADGSPKRAAPAAPQVPHPLPPEPPAWRGDRVVRPPPAGAPGGRRPWEPPAPGRTGWRSPAAGRRPWGRRWHAGTLACLQWSQISR